MRRVVRGVLGYPVVLATLAAGLVGAVLEAAGQPAVARWALSVFALAVAAQQARGMVAELRSGAHGVDLLAITAIVSTVVVGEHWAALVVCLMLSGGEALEDYAGRRARRDLTSLLERAPRLARRLGDDGAVVEVDVDEVEVGDLLLVRPFETVPVDGVLESEAASLDESSLTGESVPVPVLRGEEVLSGAVNGSEAVQVRATARAADSQYQRIVELAARAQESRAPFVRLADRVAVPFTVLALAVAALAWAVSGEGVRFAEVLVVATPCPLLIAAPVAFLGGMSRAARGGVIVKDSAAIEQLARVRTVAFDKTGTLTYGAPSVTGVHVVDGLTAERLLALASAVEEHSSHPLARAIVARARADGVERPAAVDVAEVPARGVRATVEGRAVVVGSPRFLVEETGQEVPAPPDGTSVVHVGVDGRYAGYVALADAPRPEARPTIAALHRAGVRTAVMLTGDGQGVAEHVAAELGIDDVRAHLLPQDKVEAVAGAPDRPVMMVGDGVNDSPVLAAADVGVAMGARGSSAASESADVVVLVDDLSRVAHAVLVGRRTMRVAWQAISIGLGLSVGLMLVAATGAIPAVVGAWLQELVDLACILWALLALRPGATARREMARLAAETAAVRGAAQVAAVPV